VGTADTKERTIIFGQPDKESDQHEVTQQGHGPITIQQEQLSPRIKSRSTGSQMPAIIGNKMVSEKVGVDQNGQQSRRPLRRMVTNSDIKQLPRLYKITANSSIHKTTKQGHSANLEPALIRVTRGLKLFSETESHEHPVSIQTV
jgi:hypothetical protein